MYEKKIFKLFVFLFVGFIFFYSDKVSALTFNGGTSFYDAKGPSDNSYKRLSYSAPDCSKSYCTFIADFGSINSYVDYVSFQAFVKNEWIPDNTSYMTFDYSFRFSWSDPSIEPAFSHNGAFVQMTVVGHETDFQCDTAYNYGSLNGTTMSGSCKVKIKDPGQIYNLIFNWTSTKFNDVPNSNPLLVFYPNKPISVQIMSNSTLSNFQFSMDPTLDGIDEINKKIDDINTNLDDLNKKQDETNKKLDKTNKNLKDINDYINDDSDPESDISSLVNITGIFPPGPVDSLLNIPFKFLSIIVSSLNDSCSPLNFNFVFNQPFTFPCFSDVFYSNVPDSLMLFINLVPSGFILILYFKHLYKKVERAQSLETNSDDEWGVI